MIVTTTETLEGYKIVEYIGIIVGCGDDPEDALTDLEEIGEELGANAIVGVKIFNEILDNEITYYAYGTAVRVKKLFNEREEYERN
ncbi:heavy metal-binding domain-containing protein [Methanocaldococcus sp.]